MGILLLKKKLGFVQILQFFSMNVPFLSQDQISIPGYTVNVANISLEELKFYSLPSSIKLWLTLLDGPERVLVFLLLSSVAL